jgi:Na+:H+ antiporter, NhaA family
MRCCGDRRDPHRTDWARLDHWINDGLMAIFFALVALEIKRETVGGARAGVAKAAVPLIAAAGGFVLPAAIFAAVNWGDAEAMHGCAIPAATDIAFANVT